MTWTHKGYVITELPDDCVGFVYLIVNNLNGRKYIGKKLSQFQKTQYKMHTQKNGKRVRKKIKSKIASDWETYWGSCTPLTRDITEFGINWFSREILHYCASKSETSYWEAKEQFERAVLETAQYYNGQISIRVHGSHIIKKP